MIINIQPQRAAERLAPANRSTAELQGILDDRQTPYYERQVEAAYRGRATFFPTTLLRRGPQPAASAI